MKYLFHQKMVYKTHLLLKKPSPLENDEGHKADHDCRQDGAVDGNEFVVQIVIEPLLGVAISGCGGCGGAVYRDLRREALRRKIPVRGHGVGCGRH